MEGIHNDVMAPEAHWDDLRPGFNYNATAIAHGSVVARDVAITYTAATGETAIQAAQKQRARRINGVAPLSDLNAQRILGIAHAANDRSVLVTNHCKVVRAGMTQARVIVPASTNLIEGVPLVPETTWVAATNLITWGTRLEPLVYNSVFTYPANPIAIVREAYNNTGSAAEKLLWVEVLPHSPKLVVLNYNHLLVADITVTRVHLCRALGPCMFLGMTGHLLDCGSDDNTVVSAEFHPLGATPDSQALFSTAPQIDDDGVDGAIFGAACGLDGDTDSGLGTSGAQGTLAANPTIETTKAGILIPSLAVISLTHTSGATAAANAAYAVELLYL